MPTRLNTRLSKEEFALQRGGTLLPPVLLDPVPAHHCALGKGTPVSEALDREFPSTGV